MNLKFRLTKSNDFKRVRRSGKSYAHPLVVLIVAKGESEHTRAGIVATRTVGNAVQRNKVKRQFREILRSGFPDPSTAVDIVLIAREPAGSAPFHEKYSAIVDLFRRAKLIVSNDHDTGTPAST